MTGEVTIDDTRAIAKIDAMPPKVQAAVAREARSLRGDLESLVKQKLSGGVLNVVSGKLRRSIFGKEVENSSTRIVEAVYSDGSVKYAAIHEFGGTIKHPGGTAYIVTKDMAMGAIFIKNSTAANFKTPPPRTKPHDIVMPERSFMRSSLAEMKPTIIDRLTAAAKQGAAGA